ncbi:hypothetical protein Scep_013204 [Stephania cephalantha]|uniref:Uncharacterized protein n=1 Tax=Stephania cephalantha TaxID=152367 RepID=A0AAP0PAJ7_9MAGN
MGLKRYGSLHIKGFLNSPGRSWADGFGVRAVYEGEGERRWSRGGESHGGNEIDRDDNGDGSGDNDGDDDDVAIKMKMDVKRVWGWFT